MLLCVRGNTESHIYWGLKGVQQLYFSFKDNLLLASYLLFSSLPENEEDRKSPKIMTYFFYQPKVVL